MATPYQEKVRVDGLGSVLQFYGPKVPVGKYLKVLYIGATVFTTVHGDYVTAKYVNLGFEINGRDHYIKGSDIGTGNTVISEKPDFLLKEGDRPFAEIETTATSTTYELVINGILLDKEELTSKA